jgi:hypothetical protein
MHIRWHGSVAYQVAQGNHEPIGGDDISASAPYSVAMAVGDAPWYSLSWDQWIAVAGLPLTLFGLWLAWISGKSGAKIG